MQPNARIIDRDFTDANAWDDGEYREAVRRSGKSQLIPVGQTTDVCKPLIRFLHLLDCIKVEHYQNLILSAKKLGCPCPLPTGRE